MGDIYNFYLYSKNFHHIKLISSLLNKSINISVLSDFEKSTENENLFLLIDSSSYSYFELSNFFKNLNKNNVLIFSSKNYKKIKLINSFGFDFFLKPFDYKLVNEVIYRKLEILSKNKTFCDSIPEIIGQDKKIIELKEKIMLYSASNYPVLITGETGTGKELVARAIHRLSKRGKNKLVALNCASVSNSLGQSILFGSVEGAFTDAKNTTGKLELADNSSLFLDEIGELDYNSQSLLLRVLEDNKIFKVGSNKEKNISVRIISATNIDFNYAIKNNYFRNDLYFRISPLKLKLPPLRERKEDISLLANYFLEQLKIDKILSVTAIEKLKNHSWPGNVRELKNVIKNISLMCNKKIIEASDISIEN